MIPGIFLLVLIALDQIVKTIVAGNFREGESLPLLPGFFHITYVRNRGVAFGLLQGKGGIISALTGIAVILILWYLRQNRKHISGLEKYGFLLIAAGAAGNLLDRVFRGYVVDMIDFRGIWSYIFNAADVWINVGVGFIILDYILGLARGKGKKKNANESNDKTNKTE
ncbi:MAG: signal peptidase II [Fusobacteriaceae bacterium]|jgi:signal peptidase II|nr:signal peptidase II [Fusobacteriaceae bacterium]